jgi:DNA-directed RNA polymerase subunit alpha
MWKGFQKPKRLAAELDSLTDKYGKFSAQPFERGWGTTVGNALRRALLSSIEGAAITAVKIEGVLHEFSSIPGVVEDATDIILNLKQVPLKLNNDQPKTITLNAEAAGVVTSAMIEEDADFAVLDKTVYIATVSEGGKLQLEMRVKNGRGYVGADRNFDEDLPIGYIPVDSVHSPVRKVNYSVEAARLGQMTDYDRLMLEVWTNGAITPQDAIGLAAKLIKDHMSIFINFEEPTELPEESVESYNDPRLEHLDRSVEELELSVRSYNCLKNANIQTIRELVQKTENEMLKTKNFGRSFLSECDRPHSLAAYPRRVCRRGLLLAAYSALLQLGFTVPSVSPRTRWALTPPFHPYPRFREGGLFSVALSVTGLAVPRRYLAACPWSPDFPRSSNPATASRSWPGEQWHLFHL